MVDYTEEELVKIKKKSRTSETLPTFYNSNTEQFQPISRDFEAFLILSEQKTLGTAKEWLSKVRTTSESNLERDKIVSNAILLDNQDASNKRKEANESIKCFEAFKDTFSIGKFGKVVETGMLTRDMDLFAGEQTFTMERAAHLETLTNLVDIRHSRNQVTPQLQKELESWNDVLVAYI